MGFILSLVIAYVLGSISSGVLIAKLCKLPDPRAEGSGNTGATNTLRLYGKKPALFVLIGDVLKGFVAVLLASMLGVTGGLLGLVALAAVIGHVFPVFFKFKGGKGVATAAGAFLVLSFGVTLLLLIIFAAIVYFTRYVSLASMIAAIAAPILFIFSAPALAFPALLVAGLIVWKHSDNIERLRTGTESKIEF
ncbi:MAG: acyl-phosphate glycerol 3-phosphate acyltransferase [Gammaproteobacteria bacterium RIFCSPHIGHO2_12_FULL_45_9]|nr:MAG: acyl-phosphate glycerol 3-phosphate acyltransferase [Gammaproteobacteria bacterium RIFCSPHIGHO2_12_FULL_45_9]